MRTEVPRGCAPLFWASRPGQGVMASPALDSGWGEWKGTESLRLTSSRIEGRSGPGPEERPLGVSPWPDAFPAS